MLATARAGFSPRSSPLRRLPPLAADKPFKNDDLADAAIKLEAKIKATPAASAKPLATLRRDADAAFRDNDFRTGIQVLARSSRVAPQRRRQLAATLARTILQICPPNDDERAPAGARRTPATSPISAPATPIEEADALHHRRPHLRRSQAMAAGARRLRLSLELREVADVRGTL